MNYLARRFLRGILLLWAISALCFLFTEIAPGSFFDDMRLNPQISPQTISALRARYGLDQPLVIRYGKWLASVAHGDLGYSIAYHTSVAPLLWARAKHTLVLTTTATLLIWLIGVPLGIWSAERHNGGFDILVTVGSSLLISVPEIVIALALLAFAVRWRLLPVGGMTSAGFDEMSSWGRFQDVVLRMLLPTLILVLAGIAIVTRHIRASVLEALDAPCIQAARGQGIAHRRLLFRHVLPLAGNPAISLFGFSLAALLSGSLLVEVITGWPGLGPLLLDATLARDLYLVIGGIMYSATFMLGGNFIADILLLASDPRIRSEGGHGE